MCVDQIAVFLITSRKLVEEITIWVSCVRWLDRHTTFDGPNTPEHIRNVILSRIFLTSDSTMREGVPLPVLKDSHSDVHEISSDTIRRLLDGEYKVRDRWKVSLGYPELLLDWTMYVLTFWDIELCTKAKITACLGSKGVVLYFSSLIECLYSFEDHKIWDLFANVVDVLSTEPEHLHFFRGKYGKNSLKSAAQRTQLNIYGRYSSLYILVRFSHQ